MNSTWPHGTECLLFERVALSTYDKLKNEKDEKLQEIVANKNTYRVDYYNAAKIIIEERESNENSLHQTLMHCSLTGKGEQTPRSIRT